MLHPSIGNVTRFNLRNQGSSQRHVSSKIHQASSNSNSEQLTECTTKPCFNITYGRSNEEAKHLFAYLYMLLLIVEGVLTKVNR